jgi:uncharacterized membrane protein YkvA (DUF1232 family)
MGTLRLIYARFRRELKVYQLALKHPRTPRIGRWLLAGAIAYSLSPIDLIPDFIPVLGHLDDAVIVPLMVFIAVRTIPRDVLEECRAEAERLSTAH